MALAGKSLILFAQFVAVGNFVGHRAMRILTKLIGLALVSGLAQAQHSFPDPSTLLKEIEANQQRMDEFRETFAFHRKQYFEDLDNRGRIVKTYTQEREIFFIHGQQVGRLFKLNGVPLNGNLEQAEQARVAKQIKILMKTDAKPH